MEEEIKKSGVSYSILRATQFHNYVDEILQQLLKFRLAILPKKVLVQPIDVTVVAEILVNKCFDPPSRKIENMGGREVLTLEEMVASWLSVRYKHKTVVNMPLWGRTGRNLKAG